MTNWKRVLLHDEVIEPEFGKSRVKVVSFDRGSGGIVLVIKATKEDEKGPANVEIDIAYVGDAHPGSIPRRVGFGGAPDIVMINSADLGQDIEEERVN